MVFQDRQQAGRLLSERLQALSIRNPIVFALPRGGIVVGYEVAKALRAPLEALVVRKIGAPINPEYGIGAIVEEGYYWIDSEAAQAVGATPSDLRALAEREFQEVNRRAERYRQGRPLPPLEGKTAVVVDDGLATGVTARVACHFLKNKGAERVVLAIPVCSPRTAQSLRSEVDDILCMQEPEEFYAVGQFYQEFEQVSDEEVVSFLAKARTESNAQAPELRQREVTIGDERLSLSGTLNLPRAPLGFVLFAHGSGSSRMSPRNRRVAEALVKAGFGTLLFDLLTEEESLDRDNVFDIPLLASRLVLATNWTRRQNFGKDLRLGYFGASTGAAAALWAASELAKEITAIVSRGGRPDLAMPRLPSVTAPTLLIVGGADEPVIEMNEEALKHLPNGSLVVIPDATHLFEEPGTLEQVTQEAVQWFRKYLVGAMRGKAA